MPSKLPYVAAVLADDPIGYWRLADIASGVAADRSGNGLDGVWTDAPQLVAGATVDGDGGFLRTVGSPGWPGVDVQGPPFAALTDPWAWEIWLRRNELHDLGSNDWLAALHAGTSVTASGSLAWLRHTNGRINFGIRDASGSAEDGPIIDPFFGDDLDVWNHVVIQWTGDDVEVYVNGRSRVALPFPATIAEVHTPNGLRVGDGLTSSHRGFEFDEAAVYDHPLTADRVRAHWLAASQPPDLEDHQAGVVDVEVRSAGRPVQVASWQVSREVATDLPDQVRAVSGVSIADASIDVEVTPPDAAVLEPVTRDPMLFDDVTLKVFDGAAWRPLFVGKVAEQQQDTGRETVSLECDDPAVDLAARQSDFAPLPGAVASRWLPAIVADDGVQVRPGLHPNALVEAIMRPYGFSRWPVLAAEPGLGTFFNRIDLACLASGTMWDDRNEPPTAMDDGAGGPATFRWSSRFDALVARAADGWWWRDFWNRAPQVDGVVYLMAHVTDEFAGIATIERICASASSAGSAVPVQRVRFTFTVTSGVCTLQVTVAGADPTDKTLERTLQFDPITVEPGPVTAVVAMPHWEDHTAPTDVLLQVRDAGSIVNDAGQVDSDFDTSTVVARDDMGIHVRVAGAGVAAVVHGRDQVDPDAPLDDHYASWFIDRYHEWTPNIEAAELPGDLVYTPTVGIDTPWQALRTLVASRFGGVWFDEDGRLQVRNRAQLRGVGADELLVDSYTSLVGFGWRYSSDQIYGEVRAPYLPAAIDVDDSTGVVVFEATETYTVQPGQTTPPITVQLDRAVAGPLLDHEGDYLIRATLPEPNWQLLRPGGTDPGVGTFFEAYDRDGLGGPILARITLVAPDLARIQFQWVGIPDPGATPVTIGTVDREPMFRIAARVAVTPRTQASRVTVETGTGMNRTLELDSNPFRQTLAEARRVAEDIAGEVNRPRPDVQTVEVVPDGRIRLGSVIRLRDPDVSGWDVRALVEGVRWTGAAGQVDQKLQVRPLPPTWDEFDDVWADGSWDDFDQVWAAATWLQFATDPLRR